ncbi:MULTISPECIES: membrane-anchored protein [unclassified Rhizobium]|uniref:membrane-anchored protein n=1 Tax=unclassified Rhizobium TaxID=2613769 RepID=UPI001ADCD332|nr:MULTISPECIES: membrane-anchored protein [unclassified Rhizobium]MBO9096826.1 membrane-anchored protein [Rhizobium sp. L58/93]MBO9167081.1 membrane-anchored protein [Rhizobium sp. L245/93]MBO9183053.1 membrane-anchored protein [Rhizobium sp. E27B/91]QXZ83415.1 membrane-anchored protein [Rhizobium sp. K1/93]QXZ89073.1 membrane-anchored protein [Rhizobium sp. K15/93]
MPGSFSDLKKLLYRNIKYRLTRPSPPTVTPRFEGPVLVVGSAPVSHKPADFDDRFRVVTINGSQAVTEAWGIEEPDVTFVQFNQIEGTNTNAVEVRRVLNGKRTGALFVLLWRKDERERLERGLQAFNYKPRTLTIVDRYERMALLDRVVGRKSFEMDTDSKCSNGINAVLFALYNGSTAVIITGINPNSGGHAYNQVNLSRQHVRMDQEILVRLMQQGYPVFTTDPSVSESIGLPLWQGIENVQHAGLSGERSNS